MHLGFETKQIAGSSLLHSAKRSSSRCSLLSSFEVHCCPSFAPPSPSERRSGSWVHTQHVLLLFIVVALAGRPHVRQTATKEGRTAGPHHAPATPKRKRTSSILAARSLFRCFLSPPSASASSACSRTNISRASAMEGLFRVHSRTSSYTHTRSTHARRHARTHTHTHARTHKHTCQPDRAPAKRAPRTRMQCSSCACYPSRRCCGARAGQSCTGRRRAAPRSPLPAL